MELRIQQNVLNCIDNLVIKAVVHLLDTKIINKDLIIEVNKNKSENNQCISHEHRHLHIHTHKNICVLVTGLAW